MASCAPLDLLVSVVVEKSMDEGINGARNAARNGGTDEE